MSIFGRPFSPKDYRTPQPKWESTPVESGKTLDKARARAWDLACQYAYTTGKVDMAGYEQLLEGNPYRELAE